LMGVYGFIAYRDKKVVGVFVRFSCAVQIGSPLTSGPTRHGLGDR
jgi:hypothetical protein